MTMTHISPPDLAFARGVCHSKFYPTYRTINFYQFNILFSKNYGNRVEFFELGGNTGILLFSSVLWVIPLGLFQRCISVKTEGVCRLSFNSIIMNGLAPLPKKYILPCTNFELSIKITSNDADI